MEDVSVHIFLPSASRWLFHFSAAAETESSNTAESVTIASQFLFYDERQIARIERDGIVAVGWCAEKIWNQLTVTSGCWKIAAL